MKYERTWLFNATANKFLARDPVHRGDLWGYRDHQPSRTDAANNLKEICERTLKKGARLIRFAVGRSQEVMLVLEELMTESCHPFR